MKNLTLVLSISILSLASCTQPDKSNIPSLEPPKALNDDWSKWLIGNWKGTAKSDFGEKKDWVKGSCQTSFELVLNGQFIIRKGQARIISLSDDYIKQLKSQGLDDSDIEKIRNSSFESIEFYTIDPKTGEITCYLFDSLRCVAKGTGKLEGNKKIINWTWSLAGKGTSTRTTEKISNDKLITIETYTLPDGSTMIDTIEMNRQKPW